MKTRDKILETAIRLFNEGGTAAMSTNHIADAVGISPGNLYYHFRHKEEIISAIYDRMSVEWVEIHALPEGETLTLTDLTRMVHRNFEVLWHYRFFYREMVVLVRNDDDLRRKYQAVRNGGFANFRHLFHHFIEAGVATAPSPPTTLDDLATMAWLVVEFWLTFVELGGEPVTAEQQERGVHLLMQVLRPYLVNSDQWLVISERQ